MSFTSLAVGQKKKKRSMKIYKIDTIYKPLQSWMANLGKSKEVPLKQLVIVFLLI